MRKARKKPPIPPMMAAPMSSIRCKMKPKKRPMQSEKRKEKRLLKKESSASLSPRELNMVSMEKRSMVMPKPAIPPTAKIVMGKNLRPKKATTRPKVMKLKPMINGLSRKNLEKVVTENTGHALECEAVITGEQGFFVSMSRFLKPTVVSVLSESQNKLIVNW